MNEFEGGMTKHSSVLTHFIPGIHEEWWPWPLVSKWYWTHWRTCVL